MLGVCAIILRVALLPLTDQPMLREFLLVASIPAPATLTLPPALVQPAGGVIWTDLVHRTPPTRHWLQTQYPTIPPRYWADVTDPAARAKLVTGADYVFAVYPVPVAHTRTRALTTQPLVLLLTATALVTVGAGRVPALQPLWAAWAGESPARPRPAVRVQRRPVLPAARHLDRRLGCAATRFGRATRRH